MNTGSDHAKGWDERAMKEVKTTQQVIAIINALKEEITNREKEILQAKETVRREKLRLAAILDETEKNSNDLVDKCNKQSEKKSEVEAVYQQTLDEYDRLHDVVKKVVAKEKECDNRHDLEKTLQIESFQWAEEEHTLRSKLHALQVQQREAKSRQQEEIAVMESKLRDAEARLHSDRMSREFPSNIHGKRQSTSRPGSRAGSSRAASMSLGRAGFTDDSMVLAEASGRSVSAAVPQPILINKATNRKRDHFGDLTNMS
jgi:hypothetical protein